MTVAYITMRFPTPAETFACTDIRTLIDAHVDVTVYSMRFAPPDARAVLRQRRLEGLVVSYATIVGMLRGLLEAAAHLRLAASTCGWLIGQTWRRPKFMVLSLLLLPRSFAILRELRQLRPDVVHLFWGHYPSIVAHLVRNELPGCIVSTFLGAYDLVYQYTPSARVAREAHVVWTHAHDNVSALQRLGVPPGRVAVAHRGIDLESFRPAHRKIARRIVCAARLCYDKHVDHVLEAFASVLARWPDASLVIMGDGPERQRLEAMSATLGLSGAVRFTGHVPHTVVCQEMAVADYFLLMSQEETERLTNSTKEAMACECVCVVTPSPGIDELMTDGVHGFVVDRGDVRGAAARIEWSILHADEAAQMREAAAARIRTRFDVTSSMKVYRERWIQLARQQCTTELAKVAS